jgi:hypothetical protein
MDVHQDADIHRNDSDRTMRVEKFSVAEAAQVLGISAEAVRQRIKRGTLDTEKSVEGTVYVLLDTDLTRNDNVRSGDRTGESGALISELRAHNATLREQLEAEREARRRADTIIAQLTQANAALAARVPELEAPPEPREAPVTATEEPDSGEPRPATEGPQTGTERRSSWWRRLVLGG